MRTSSAANDVTGNSSCASPSSAITCALDSSNTSPGSSQRSTKQQNVPRTPIASPIAAPGNNACMSRSGHVENATDVSLCDCPVLTVHASYRAMCDCTYVCACLREVLRRDAGASLLQRDLSGASTRASRAVFLVAQQRGIGDEPWRDLFDARKKELIGRVAHRCVDRDSGCIDHHPIKRISNRSPNR